MKFAGSWWFILLKRKKIKRLSLNLMEYVKAYIMSNMLACMIMLRPLLKRMLYS